jgi:hypothetical protein
MMPDLSEGQSKRLAELIALQHSFITNALHSFARRMEIAADELGGRGQYARAFAEQAEEARELARDIEEIVLPDDDEVDA